MKRIIILAVSSTLLFFVFVGVYQSWLSQRDDTSLEKETETLLNPSYVYECSKGQTAYDLLKQRTSTVETQDYSFGKLVTAIDGVRNGADGKNWIYYVDAQVASVSADNYKCLGQESVEWKFEPSPY